MKIFRVLIIFFFLTNNVFALSQGVNSPTQNSGGWSNGANGYSSDDSRATLAWNAVTKTHNYWGYGFTLPTYATVLGVEVICESRHTPECNDWGKISIEVSEDGGLNWSTAEESTPITGTDTDYTFGGSSSLWGLSLTPSEVNTDNFRTRITGVVCIVEGSLIKLPTETRLVEELKVGDKITSFDGENYYNDDVIENITENITDKVYIINNELMVTAEHPIFCVEKNDYVKTKELSVGNTLKYLKQISADKFEIVNKEIVDIRIENRNARVFDVAVKGNKNFWANGYLVHNKGAIACDSGFSWQWQLDWIRVRVYYSIPWIVKKVFYQDKIIILKK